MVSTAIVLSGGDGAPSTPLPRADLVVAADSGLQLAERLGLRVDLIVGDMDSVDPEVLDAAVAAGAAMERHHVDKDATDLELALDAARARGVHRMVIAGGGGGRLDHLLANAALIASDRYRDIDVTWQVGDDVATVVRDRHTISGSPGDIVSLLAVGGPATVTTHGLHWELDGGRLEPATTRGVSNRLVAEPASVIVEAGTLVVIVRSGS